MWSLIQNLRFYSATLALSLLIIFIVTVLGCSAGIMPYSSVMHSDISECSGMFMNMFALSDKEMGAMQLWMFLISALVFVAVGSSVLLKQLLVLLNRMYSIRKVYGRLWHVRDHILQQFSQGILHPQIY